MVLETCVYLKMIHVLTVIKMMVEAQKLVFYFLRLALPDIKTMALETSVFLKMIHVPKDTKMMED